MHKKEEDEEEEEEENTTAPEINLRNGVENPTWRPSFAEFELVTWVLGPISRYHRFDIDNEAGIWLWG